MRRLVVVVGWMAFLAVATGGLCNRPPGPPIVYEVPDGFEGWVTIEYGVPGAPPLAREDGSDVVRVPADGKVATSSKYIGWRRGHEYWRVGAGGARTPLPLSRDVNVDQFPEVTVSGLSTYHSRYTTDLFHVGRTADRAGKPAFVPP
ncbi:MAG TPA: hypothetical protein VL172_17880 [Kofleriaceae bacterium]|jgi:hypothetical protein|nr:hypothetical protein [Kofleriaceae bacterium]